MAAGSGEPTSRRRLLRAAAVAGATAVAGCSFSDDRRSPTATPGSRSPAGGAMSALAADPRFETVHNVVDRGIDPDGGESIVPFLESRAGDRTALYFPPGRYLVDDVWALPEFSDLALVGDGATIVTPRGYDRYLFAVGSEGHRARGLRLEGLRFDVRRGSGARPVQAIVEDGLLVRDVEIVGASGAVRFDVMGPDGTGRVERLRMPDGGPSVGCFVGPITRGDLAFVDCHIARFADNGLYASPPKGSVTVSGGSYRNNAIANVRVSGDSVVRGVHVRCDTAPEGFRNMRGIRFRHGAGGLIEDCTVEMLEVTYSEGAIVLGGLMESATIRDTLVRVSADRVAALRAKSPSVAPHRGGSAVRCENLTISGAGSGDSTVVLVDRDDTLLEGLRVTQTGADRNGIHLIRSNDSVIRDTRIDVTGDPLITEQCSPRLENVTVAPGTDRDEGR